MKPESSQAPEIASTVVKSAAVAENTSAVLARVEERLKALRSSGAASEADSTTRAARELGRGFVLGTLILAGTVLLSVVLITKADWFYPTVFFGLATYFVWQRYF